jgi:hypothetical protein
MMVMGIEVMAQESHEARRAGPPVQTEEKSYKN